MLNDINSKIITNQKIKMICFLAFVFIVCASCNKSDTTDIRTDPNTGFDDDHKLPIRPGSHPETTDNIPHVQIDVNIIPEIHEEMIRSIYEISGIEDRPSVIASWRGLWISEDFTIQVPKALISGREFGHIHDDGSLHIFLEPDRAKEAVESGWAVFHPFALAGDEEWEGFVMLYTPLTKHQLDITLQLIREAYNYVTTGDILRSMD